MIRLAFAVLTSVGVWFMINHFHLSHVVLQVFTCGVVGALSLSLMRK